MRQTCTKNVVFSIERWAQIIFYNLYITQKKKNTKMTKKKKITKNIPSQSDYINHDIGILQINQIIFFLSHVTIFRNFVLSQATA